MSGFLNRLSTVFRAKADKALDKMEDPNQTLDYSYKKQLELLQKVRRGVADVATSRKKVELQATQLNTQIDKLNSQAQKALEVGREDLAREALTRKSGLQQQLGDLQTQHAQLQADEEKLVSASRSLQAKVDAFRTRKETLKATYTAAQAQAAVNEAFTGIGEEMGDVGLAIQRSEDKIAEMQARAGAMDELLASGAMDDITGSSKDDITRELEALSSGSQVEDELARMKAQLGSGPAAAPQALEGPGTRYEQVPQTPQSPPQQAPRQQGQGAPGQQQAQGYPQQPDEQPPFQAYPVEGQPGQEGQR